MKTKNPTPKHIHVTCPVFFMTRLVPLLLLCLMLGACSIGQPSKPSSFYVLTPQVSMTDSMTLSANSTANTAGSPTGSPTGSTPSPTSTTAPTETTADPKKVIGVGPIKIPSYIDRPQMVLRSGQEVLITLDEFNRWGEPLSDNVPRVVTDMVALHAGPDISVIQYPSASNRHANVWITMNINRLDGALGESATLDTWWSIISRDGDLLHAGRFHHSIPVGQDYADLAKAESTLLWLATKAAMEFVEF